MADLVNFEKVYVKFVIYNFKDMQSCLEPWIYKQYFIQNL
jgi:hypothetical protein